MDTKDTKTCNSRVPYNRLIQVIIRIRNTRKAFLPQRDFLLFSVLNSLSLFLPLSVAFTNPKVIRPSFYYTTTESQNERTCQLWDTAMVDPPK